MKAKNKLRMKTLLTGLVVVAPIATVTSCNLAKDDDKDKTTVEVMPSGGGDSSNGSNSDGSNVDSRENQDRSGGNTDSGSNGNGNDRNTNGSGTNTGNRDNHRDGNTGNHNKPTDVSGSHTGDGTDINKKPTDNGGDNNNGTSIPKTKPKPETKPKPKPETKPKLKPKPESKPKPKPETKPKPEHKTKPKDTGTSSHNQNYEYDMRTLQQIENISRGRTFIHILSKSEEIANSIKDVYDLEEELGIDLSFLDNNKSKISIKAIGSSQGHITINLSTRLGARKSFKIYRKSDYEIGLRLSSWKNQWVNTDSLNSTKLDGDTFIGLEKINKKISDTLFVLKQRFNSPQELVSKLKSLHHIKRYFGIDFMEIVKQYVSVKINFDASIDEYDSNLIKINFKMNAKGTVSEKTSSVNYNIAVPFIRNWSQNTSGTHHVGDVHSTGETIIVDDSFHKAHPNWKFMAYPKYNYNFSRLTVAWTGMFSQLWQTQDYDEPLKSWPSNFGTNFSSLKIINKDAFNKLESLPYEITRTLNNVEYIGANAFESLKSLPVSNAFASVRYLGAKSFFSLKRIDNLSVRNIVTLEDSAIHSITSFPYGFEFPKLKKLVNPYWELRNMPSGLRMPILEELSGANDSGSYGAFGAYDNGWFDSSQIYMPNLRIIGRNTFRNIKGKIPSGLFPNVEIIRGENAFGTEHAPSSYTFPKLRSIDYNSIHPQWNDTLKWIKNWDGRVTPELVSQWGGLLGVKSLQEFQDVVDWINYIKRFIKTNK